MSEHQRETMKAILQVEDDPKAIKDFWLTQNTLPLESQSAPIAPDLPHWRTTGLATKCLPAINPVSNGKSPNHPQPNL